MAFPTHDRATFRVHDDATWPHTGERPAGCQSVMHSTVLEPLTEAKMRDLRRAGRKVGAFEGLVIEIMRPQMTSAVMPPRDDPEALRGPSDFSASFRDGLASPCFEAVARQPSNCVRRNTFRKVAVTFRYSRASAADSTPIELRDLVSSHPRILPRIAEVAFMTLVRLIATTDLS